MFCRQREEAEGESGSIRPMDFQGSGDPGGQQPKERLTCASVDVSGSFCPPVLQTLAPRTAFFPLSLLSFQTLLFLSMKCQFEYEP